MLRHPPFCHSIQSLDPLFSFPPWALCLNTKTAGQPFWLTGRSTLTISDGSICTSPITESSPTRTLNPMAGCLCTDIQNNITAWQEKVLVRYSIHLKTWIKGKKKSCISVEWVCQTGGAPLQTEEKSKKKDLLHTVLERQSKIENLQRLELLTLFMAQSTRTLSFPQSTWHKNTL